MYMHDTHNVLRAKKGKRHKIDSKFLQKFTLYDLSQKKWETSACLIFNTTRGENEKKTWIFPSVCNLIIKLIYRRRNIWEIYASWGSKQKKTIIIQTIHCVLLFSTRRKKISDGRIQFYKMSEKNMHFNLQMDSHPCFLWVARVWEGEKGARWEKNLENTHREVHSLRR